MLGAMRRIRRCGPRPCSLPIDIPLPSVAPAHVYPPPIESITPPPWRGEGRGCGRAGGRERGAAASHRIIEVVAAALQKSCTTDLIRTPTLRRMADEPNVSRAAAGSSSRMSSEESSVIRKAKSMRKSVVWPEAASISHSMSSGVGAASVSGATPVRMYMKLKSLPCTCCGRPHCAQPSTCASSPCLSCWNALPKVQPTSMPSIPGMTSVPRFCLA